ncbi:MAG: electron transport complex subunit RsxC [Candidatus Eisenbacteria bacterium]|jgi:electron transport complex protein RnfC|nr:electron transport complex subunit RsxC [Candidatus Eisenbacteria bacterium]
MHLMHASWGIHPRPGKDTTAGLATRRAPIPERLVIPLSQHTGVPCKPLVKPKQEVVRGEMIGDVDALITAPVHASIAGTVEKIEPRPHSSGAFSPSVVLTPRDSPLPAATAVRSIDVGLALPPDEIRSIARSAGIVGMGGAGFPTHVKLSPPPPKKVEVCVLNGAECEPFLTADHRIMLERSAEVLDGMRLIMHALGAASGIIGVEDNKLDAAHAMAAAVERAGERAIRVQIVHTRYPQGAEKTLIQTLTGREVPSGGLPADVGVLVSNVGTAAAVRDAVCDGTPLIERVVTVAGGAVGKPANLLALVGTPIRVLLDECGWMPGRTQRVILGGPLMGAAIHDLDIPVTKTTSGILALTNDELHASAEYPCIGCGRCVQACPMHLVPSTLAKLCKLGREAKAKDAGLLDCFECGSCAYGCPAKIPLVHWLRVGKASLRRNKAA